MLRACNLLAYFEMHCTGPLQIGSFVKVLKPEDEEKGDITLRSENSSTSSLEPTNEPGKCKRWINTGGKMQCAAKTQPKLLVMHTMM